MRAIDSVLDIIDNYDTILCDMNGVLSNGKSILDGVLNTLEVIFDKNKNFIIVSNATRTSCMISESLENFGVPTKFCTKIITSGDVLRMVIKEKKSIFADLGDTYNFFVIGNYNFLEGLQESIPDRKINVVRSISDANCILVNGVPAEIKYGDNSFFNDILKRNIPLICTNPDQVALSGDSFIECPGYTSAVYQKMGGHVYEYGKPHKVIYNYIFEKYPELNKHKVLCVGDTLVTDIKGAANMGLDSLLITGGVLKKIKKDKSSMSDLCARYGVEPDYYTEYFGVM